MSMPVQKPHQSKQDYQTPVEVIKAAEYLIGSSFVWDLAAESANKICTHFYSPTDDALKKPWNKKGWCWLNPPFANIDPWVHKAFMESTLQGAHIAVLIPASVGSNWWKKWVHEKAQVYLLNGRITFVGQDAPYPKDCALLLYRPNVRGGYSVFNWDHADYF